MPFAQKWLRRMNLTQIFLSSSNRLSSGAELQFYRRSFSTGSSEKISFDRPQRKVQVFNVLQLLVYEKGYRHIPPFGRVSPILARIVPRIRNPNKGLAQFVEEEDWQQKAVDVTYDSLGFIRYNNLDQFQDFKELQETTLPQLYNILSLSQRKELFNHVEIFLTDIQWKPKPGKPFNTEKLLLDSIVSTRFADYLHRLDMNREDPSFDSAGFIHYLHDLPPPDTPSCAGEMWQDHWTQSQESMYGYKQDADTKVDPFEVMILSNSEEDEGDIHQCQFFLHIGWDWFLTKIRSGPNGPVWISTLNTWDVLLGQSFDSWRNVIPDTPTQEESRRIASMIRKEEMDQDQQERYEVKKMYHEARKALDDARQNKFELSAQDLFDRALDIEGDAKLMIREAARSNIDSIEGKSELPLIEGDQAYDEVQDDTDSEESQSDIHKVSEKANPAKKQKLSETDPDKTDYLYNFASEEEAEGNEDKKNKQERQSTGGKTDEEEKAVLVRQARMNLGEAHFGLDMEYLRAQQYLNELRLKEEKRKKERESRARKRISTRKSKKRKRISKFIRTL